MLATDDPPSAAAHRYVRAKLIATELLDTVAELRERALVTACADDSALRDEVQWLLDAAHDCALDIDAPLTFSDPLTGGAVHLAAPVPREYRLLRRIGEGGMGVVYLAERIDGQLQQRVALKLLHSLPDNDVLTQRRFATERRILATLSHPNIAHLIDGGVSTAGRPFLAMEYVAGERIDAYCDNHALNQRQRIALFLKVCAAVEHAHQRLVIHRDIKPSNILIDRDGQPKLLDFGIARLLDDSQAERTGTEQRVLTLLHASPEQIEGGPLSTASDVYSLGVLLYQLLAGVRPFEHLGSAHQRTQAIVTGHVTPPSRRVQVASTAGTESASSTVRRVRQRIPADLDAIVLKAMRLEPEQRYATASALAADLRRFLSERPVRARRGNLSYRLRRFAWRRRWALFAVCSVVLAMTIATLDRLHQHANIVIERDRATAVVQYMDALYQNTDALHVRGKDVTVRQMLDVGAASLRTRSDLSPAHQAALLVATGRAYNALGLAQDAVPLLELARDILKHDGSSAAQHAALSLALAAAYSGSRRLGDAIAADEDALRWLQADSASNADDIAQATIRSLHNHAVKLDLPLQQIRDQLQIVLKRLDVRDNAPVSLKIAAYRALVMASGGDNVAALAAAEQVMRIATAAYPEGDPRLLPARYIHVTALQQDDPQRAAALLPQLIADHEQRMGASVRVASLLGNLGNTLIRIGKADQSVPVFERALTMLRQISGEHSQLFHLTSSNYAEAQLALGNGQRATELVHRVLPELIATAQSEGDTEAQVFLASARETLAKAALLRGDMLYAQQQFAQAAEGLARIEREAYPQMYARMLLELAQVQQKRGDTAGSAQTLARFDAAIADHTDSETIELRERAAAMRATSAFATRSTQR